MPPYRTRPVALVRRPVPFGVQLYVAGAFVAGCAPLARLAPHDQGAFPAGPERRPARALVAELAGVPEGNRGGGTSALDPRVAADDPFSAETGGGESVVQLAAAGL